MEKKEEIGGRTLKIFSKTKFTFFPKFKKMLKKNKIRENLFDTISCKLNYLYKRRQLNT